MPSFITANSRNHKKTALCLCRGRLFGIGDTLGDQKRENQTAREPAYSFRSFFSRAEPSMISTMAPQGGDGLQTIDRIHERNLLYNGELAYANL